MGHLDLEKDQRRHEAIVPARPHFSLLRVAQSWANQTRASTSTYPNLETMSTRVAFRASGHQQRKKASTDSASQKTVFPNLLHFKLHRSALETRSSSCHNSLSDISIRIYSSQFASSQVYFDSIPSPLGCLNPCFV